MVFENFREESNVCRAPTKSSSGIRYVRWRLGSFFCLYCLNISLTLSFSKLIWKGNKFTIRYLSTTIILRLEDVDTVVTPDNVAAFI